MNGILDIMADMKAIAEDFVNEGLAFVKRQKEYEEQLNTK